MFIPSRILFTYIIHGHWCSVESNLLISSLWSWLKYYLRQIYIHITYYILYIISFYYVIHFTWKDYLDQFSQHFFHADRNLKNKTKQLIDFRGYKKKKTNAGIIWLCVFIMSHESILCSSLIPKEVLARNRCNIWNLSYLTGTRAHNHLG